MVKYFSSDSFFLEKSVLSSLISKKESFNHNVGTIYCRRPYILESGKNCPMVWAKSVHG